MLPEIEGCSISGNTDVAYKIKVTTNVASNMLPSVWGALVPRGSTALVVCSLASQPIPQPTVIGAVHPNDCRLGNGLASETR